ncbi:MAG: hypothetical protein OXG15_12525 [Gammaproteobacteria bacterium]|nr:hypothetical protein [Gammaproteobacteria bacterium]
METLHDRRRYHPRRDVFKRISEQSHSRKVDVPTRIVIYEQDLRRREAVVRHLLPSSK